MKQQKFKLKQKLYIWPAEAANWYFLSIAKAAGKEIKEKYASSSRGFGSLPVEVKIGKTVWKTSIFPEKSSGSYILPFKAAVRKAEGLFADDEVEFTLQVGGEGAGSKKKSVRNKDS